VIVPNSTYDIVKVELSTLQGDIITTTSLEGATKIKFDVSLLSKGTHIVYVTHNGVVSTYKIIKN